MLREFGKYMWDMAKFVVTLMVIIYCANRFIDATIDQSFSFGFLWMLPISLILTYAKHYAYKRGYKKGHMDGHHKGYELAKDIAKTSYKDTRRSF